MAKDPYEELEESLSDLIIAKEGIRRSQERLLNAYSGVIADQTNRLHGNYNEMNPTERQSVLDGLGRVTDELKGITPSYGQKEPELERITGKEYNEVKTDSADSAIQEFASDAIPEPEKSIRQYARTGKRFSFRKAILVREKAKLSQIDLVKKLGLPESYRQRLSALENQKITPSYDSRSKLDRAYLSWLKLRGVKVFR